jgi:hypothetical protein
VDPERLATRRTRVVSALRANMQSLAAARQVRPRRRALWAFVSLAAALSLWAGGRRFSEHRAREASSLTFVGSVGQTVARGALPRNLQPGEALYGDPGELATADNGSAELVSAAGLGLRLGGATRVSLAGLVGAEAKNQVELRDGTLTCSVPHLHEGQHFSVTTPDARVVVHGTVFSVRVDSAHLKGAQTCVQVTDGVVVVQHAGTEVALNTGDRWGCEAKAEPALPSAAPTSDGTPEASAEPASMLPPAPHAAASAVVHAAARPGTLSEENRLFRDALAAERLGQRARAQSLLGQLLTSYPSSPLAPEAHRAQARLASATVGQ